MYYKNILSLVIVGLITACGGGSSSNPTDGGSDGGGSIDNIAGTWVATSSGDFGREEYWVIEADGDFDAYVYTDGKQLFDPVQQVNFDVGRCFDSQIGTIAAIGDDLYTIDGRFNESGVNSSYQLALNTDDTLQAAYTSDLVVCDDNGCGALAVDAALPRADSNFTAESLFTCPTGPIASIEPLITADAGATTSPSWNCTFVNQDDREAEPVTSSITLGRDGTGLVSGTRSFTWGSQDNQTIEASYTDGSGGGFILKNIILYEADGIINRATALDQSIREGDNGGAPVSTWFEMDCDLQ